MEKEEKKDITIADVAEALGVSKTTVSRAISGKGRIGKETRKRVMEYRRTIISRTLSPRDWHSRKRTISVW